MLSSTANDEHDEHVDNGILTPYGLAPRRHGGSMGELGAARWHRNIVAAGEGHCLVSRIGGQTPLITVQPESICPGIATAGRFEVKAIGPSLTYKWYLNGSEIFGANGSAYQINNVQATNVGTYHAVVSNAAGSAASQSATLTIGYPLELNVSPTNSSFKLLYGQELNLSVSPTNVSRVWNDHIYVDPQWRTCSHADGHQLSSENSKQ